MAPRFHTSSQTSAPLVSTSCIDFLFGATIIGNNSGAQRRLLSCSFDFVRDGINYGRCVLKVEDKNIAHKNRDVRSKKYLRKPLVGVSRLALDDERHDREAKGHLRSAEN